MLSKLPNFKRLGIDKEMTLEFNEHNETDLQKLIKSSYFENPYITNRTDGAEYAEVEVIKCRYDSWWYSNLIGFTFFCEIQYSDYGRGRFIKDFLGVKLSKNKKIVFRHLDPEDVIII